MTLTLAQIKELQRNHAVVRTSQKRLERLLDQVSGAIDAHRRETLANGSCATLVLINQLMLEDWIDDTGKLCWHVEQRCVRTFTHEDLLTVLDAMARNGLVERDGTREAWKLTEKGAEVQFALLPAETTDNGKDYVSVAAAK